MYPINDTGFHSFTIATVKSFGKMWYLSSSTGQVLAQYYMAPSRPIPKPGDECRVYGRGGDDIRGLFIGGEEVFYRTGVGQGRWICRRNVAKRPEIVHGNARLVARE